MNEQPKHAGGRPPMPAGARADKQITLRVTSRRKAAYVHASTSTRPKKTLSGWCFQALDREAGYTADPGTSGD